MNSQTSGSRWLLILAVWAAGLGAAAQYGKVSVVFDQLGALYPEAGAALSLSVSMTGVLGILLGAVTGLFVSSFGYRRALVWALWTGAAMSALQALHLPYGLFLATRVAEGLSHLGIVVAGPTLMALLADERQQGTALTVWSTFFGVAFALLNWLGLPLVASHGLLALFAAHAVLMAALAVLLHWALRDLPVPPRQPVPQLAMLPALHLRIYRSAFKLAPAAGWLFYTSCFVALLTVLPPHLPAGQRAFVMGAFPLISITSSMTAGVALLRVLPAVNLTQAGFAFCAAAGLWLWAVPGDWLACFALAAAFGLVQSGSFAAVPQLNSSAAGQAEANGAMSQAGNAGNVIGTPLLLAALGLAGYGGMMLVVCGLFLAGIAVHQLLALRRRAWA
ncbi:MFS transporter [Leisingera sp. ANG-Vp]|uniref:MFS transporter n=1 Tax=Leisingera sp. ANG-Vp TaxID=1577896 RepID=UPI00057FF7AF|nr:MFS transporter [Leisingera sp. ANG-Vp]KIC22613.1 membrane protein [Leisingera sp. ANG-Vp]